MSITQYIASLISVSITMFLIPGFTDVLRVYVIATIVLISILINLLFRWRQFRDYIVNKIITEVIIELIKDEDVRKVIKKLSNGQTEN